MEMSLTPITQVQSRAIRKVRDFRNAFLLNERLISTSRKIELAERGLAILEVLLALRFVFQLFNASYLNPIAAIVYVITFPFVVPFYGLSGLHAATGLLNPLSSTLAAIMAWAIVTWGAIAFTRINLQREMR